MTKQAVFELSNNDPEHYGEISARIDIPWNCRRVKYWVDSVNTFAQLLITEKTDYIDMHWDRKTIGYQGKSDYKEGQDSYENYFALYGDERLKTTVSLKILIKLATGCDLDQRNINLWEYLSNNDKLVFYKRDKNYQNPVETQATFNAGITLSLYAVFDTTGFDEEGIYLTMSIPSLSMTEAFQWRVTKVGKDMHLVAINNSLSNVKPITKYIDHRFMLPDNSEWKERTLKANLTKILQATIEVEDEDSGELVGKQVEIKITDNESHTGLVYTLNVDSRAENFFFSGMSHRAQLVMGYYNFDFNNENNVSDSTQTSPSMPLVHFGNMLYLVSNNGNVIHSSNCQNPSVIYRIQQTFMPNAPILQKPLKSERDEVIADASALREFRITLTDRWLVPVKIKTPLVVTIKMKPIREDVPTYG
jgi:hypothetical protein